MARPQKILKQRDGQPSFPVLNKNNITGTGGGCAEPWQSGVKRQPFVEQPGKPAKLATWLHINSSGASHNVHNSFCCGK
jgi:hypothetical protein